jgi:two-component system CheB/CheR fusion protein
LGKRAPASLRTIQRGGLDARRGSIRIALIYAGVASAWILLSDRVLIFFGPAAFVVSTIKGLFFVGSTAWMLYLLAYRQSSALEGSEAQLRSTIESMVDGVVVADLEGQIVHANHAALALLGLREVPPPEARTLEPNRSAEGRSSSGPLVRGLEQPQADSQRERGPLHEALASALHGEPVSGRVVVLNRAAGPVLHVSVSASPIAKDDRIVGAVAVLHDVSEPRKAEETLRRYQMLVQHSRDIILFIRRDDGRILDVNAAATRAYGYRRDELLAMSIHDLRSPDSRGAIAVQMEESAAHGLLFQTVHRRKDGSLFPVEVSSQGATIGGVGTLVSVVRDTAERVRAEEALRESERRHRALSETLQETNRRKDEFLALLSHELRNPLAPVANSLYVLGRAPQGGEQARRALAVIDRQTRHLARLVDGLLDATRISHGKIRLELRPLDLTELLQRSAEDHRPEFETCGVQLELLAAPDPLFVNGDSTRLAQVFGNLLQNAAKFTPRGGRATVALEQEEGEAVVRVRDTGAGVAKELLPELFKPFVQADRTLDRSKGGLGLGLALVKDLVELHRGTVAMNSDGVGKGTEFVVRLPLEVAAPRSPTAETRPVGVSGGRRVLVIEDNADAADSLKEVLELNAYVVEIASTGLEGIAKARSGRPDVVLCDIGLPGIDGHEVARRIRADPELGSIHLIALSGYALPEDVERSRRAGFEDHLAKPPSLEVLERRLARLWPGPGDAVREPAGDSL